jgi:protoheme IX farnesyltransferase
MARTVGRPIVRGLLTPKQAYQFAAAAGTIGVTVLCAGVNTTVGILGGFNILLYAWLYTSLKRTHIVNTWIGALVGAIPPLMGWAASSPLTDPGAWCLAALLYAWQFPHFNALSHGIRQDYKGAGYVMTCFVNPRLNARVGLRYALLMFPICALLTYYGVTDSVFPWDSALLNGWMAYWSYKFWYQQRLNYAKGTTPSVEGMKLANIYAKKTFWASVWHLPGVLILAMLHKKGRWDWLFGTGAFE